MSNTNPFNVKRPWGEFRQFTSDGEPVTVKTILIRNGELFSLQYHTKREEFWRVLSGTPVVTIGEKIVRAKAGDEFIVPRKALHRIAAEGGDALILEIARGEFDEEDVVHVEDKYGRI